MRRAARLSQKPEKVEKITATIDKSRKIAHTVTNTWNRPEPKKKIGTTVPRALGGTTPMSAMPRASEPMPKKIRPAVRGSPP